MRTRLFAIRGKDSYVFINPAQVVAIAMTNNSGTEIFCADGESFVTVDNLMDVVDRYKTAPDVACDHKEILAHMNLHSGGSEGGGKCKL